MGAKEEAKLLCLLCRMLHARIVIEVGVFVGYTTLALAQTLGENGRVIGLEIDRSFVQLGEPAWFSSGVSYKIDLRIAPAVESMRKLLDTHGSMIDLIFIDADKVARRRVCVMCSVCLDNLTRAHNRSTTARTSRWRNS